jgi:hypothetical protein
LFNSHNHYGQRQDGDLYNLLLWRQLHNQLFLMNPFDPNYKAQISMRDLERSRKTAYQASRIVNEKRKTGVEPSKSEAQRLGAHGGSDPQNMVVEMPKMALHKRTREKKR